METHIHRREGEHGLATILRVESDEVLVGGRRRNRKDLTAGQRVIGLKVLVAAVECGDNDDIVEEIQVAI